MTRLHLSRFGNKEYQNMVENTAGLPFMSTTSTDGRLSSEKDHLIVLNSLDQEHNMTKLLQ